MTTIHSMVCQECGAPFQTHRSQRRYCSHKCRSVSWRRMARAGYVPAERTPSTRTCRHCGEAFEIIAGEVGRPRVYCSGQCQRSAATERAQARAGARNDQADPGGGQLSMPFDV